MFHETLFFKKRGKLRVLHVKVCPVRLIGTTPAGRPTGHERLRVPALLASDKGWPGHRTCDFHWMQTMSADSKTSMIERATVAVGKFRVSMACRLSLQVVHLAH